MSRHFVEGFQEKYKEFLPWIAVTTFIVTGLILRVMLLNVFFISPDEAWHFDIASHPSFKDVIAANFDESVHPPLYYLLLHALIKLNDHVGTLRILSVIPWVLWVIVCYRIGLQINGKRMGLIWAALAAFSAGGLEYSLSIREYMWMLLFSTLQFGCFLSLYQKPAYRVAIAYFLYGMAAISFEYSACISILIMGMMLGWRQLKAGLKPMGMTACIAAIHLSLALYFGFLYSQHSFHQLENIRWIDSYYYVHPVYALLILFYQTSIFIIKFYPVVDQCVLVALIAIIPLFIRSFPVIAAYLIVSVLVMSALNYYALYPSPSALRFMAWMLPGILGLLAFGIERLYLCVTARMRSYAVIASIGAVMWSSVACFTVADALTMPEYESFQKTAKAIDPKDIVFTDIQTAITLRYREDWKVMARLPHLDEARWDKHTVLYPNWRKMDLIDTVSGMVVGGLLLDEQTFMHFAEDISTRQKNKAIISFVWLVQLGQPARLSKLCLKAIERFGVGNFSKKALIVRFTPEAFIEFANYCSANASQLQQ